VKVKITGTQSYSQMRPVHDPKTGEQTGTQEVPQLRVSAVPEGDDPQQALMRVDVLVHDPSDADLAKYRPGKVLDAHDLASEAVKKEQAAAAEATPGK